jgi:hypothetical protein
MPDTTIKKVSSGASPKGEMGQVYLVSGKRVSLRLWRDEEPQSKQPVRRDYETVGYVISGRAELTMRDKRSISSRGIRCLCLQEPSTVIGLRRISRPSRRRLRRRKSTDATRYNAGRHDRRIKIWDRAWFFGE